MRQSHRAIYMIYPLNKPFFWETWSNTELKAVLTKHLYVKSIHKKNIEFKFCDIWFHFPNIFDSSDHKANIKISFTISGLFTQRGTQYACMHVNHIVCSCRLMLSAFQYCLYFCLKLKFYIYKYVNYVMYTVVNKKKLLRYTILHINGRCTHRLYQYFIFMEF